MATIMEQAPIANLDQKQVSRLFAVATAVRRESLPFLHHYYMGTIVEVFGKVGSL